MGIPSECVISWGDLPERFRCAICLELVENPVELPCSHMFCLSCVNDCEVCPMDRSEIIEPDGMWLVRDSNVTVWRMYTDIRLRCYGSLLGCSWTGGPNEYKQHVEECTNAFRMKEFTECTKGRTLYRLASSLHHDMEADIPLIDSKLQCLPALNTRAMSLLYLSRSSDDDSIQDLVSTLYNTCIIIMEKWGSYWFVNQADVDRDILNLLGIVKSMAGLLDMRDRVKSINEWISSIQKYQLSLNVGGLPLGAGVRRRSCMPYKGY